MDEWMEWMSNAYFELGVRKAEKAAEERRREKERGDNGDER